MISLFCVLLALPLVFCGQCPGACQDKSLPCSAGYANGLCPGGSNIACCQMATPNCDGQCQDNSLPCDTQYATNQCPGGNNIQCCINGTGPSPSPVANLSCSKFANSQWNCALPDCKSHVCTGCGQPNYQCAEFVARSLASSKLIPISPLAPRSNYGAFKAMGKTYNLLWTSSRAGGIRGLEDYLKDSKWKSCGATASCIHECSGILVVGSEGPWSHAVVGVGNQLIDAHNVARYHVTPSTYHLNAVWNPPANIHEIVAQQQAERDLLPPLDESSIKFKEPHEKPF